MSKCTTSAGTGHRVRRGCPRRASSGVACVHVLRQPAGGPGMNLPYGSVASIGMSSTSVSVELEAEHRRAPGALTDAQVAMPVAPSAAGAAGRSRRAACRSRPGRSSAGRRAVGTRAGRPGARRATCRSGSGRPRACPCWSRPGCRRRLPRTPSGPGWFLARVSTMNAWFAGDLVAVAGVAVRAEGDAAGRPACSGTKTVAAALDGLVDAVVEELAEEREQRVVRRREADVGRHVRDEQRLVRRRAAGGTPSTGGAASGPGRWCTGTTLGSALGADRVAGRRDRRRVRRGLVDDQVADRRAAASRRRCPSSACSDDGPGRAEARAGPARRRGSRRRPGAGTPGPRRAKRSRPREQVVARAVDRAQAVRRQAVRDLVVGMPPGCRRACRTGCSRVSVAACCSAILICFRMKCRSPGVTVKPWPGGAGGRLGAARPDRGDRDDRDLGDEEQHRRDGDRSVKCPPPESVAEKCGYCPSGAYQTW